MPSKLTRICVAALLACAGLLPCRVAGAGRRDAGYRHQEFRPRRRRADLFVNENLAVAPGSAGPPPGPPSTEPTGPALRASLGGVRRARTTVTTGSPSAAPASSLRRRESRATGPRRATRRTATGGPSRTAAARGGRFEHKAAADRRTGAARHARAGRRHAAAKSASRQAEPGPPLRLAGRRWTGPAAPPYKRRHGQGAVSEDARPRQRFCRARRPPRRARDRIGAARALADRHTGIGCDQLILLEPPADPAAQLFMRIRNPDGSEAEACGNATRCVAWLVRRETGERRVRIETVAGLLEAEIMADGQVAVDMGPARIGWREIPLARAMDTDRVDLALGPLSTPVCTNIGNPHATFFVDDAEAIDPGRARPRARARSAVSRARQYRRRDGARSATHPAARLGARRRHHPRLRQRRLRRAGRRASPRPRRAPRAGRARRRRPRHRLARGRPRRS